MSFLGGLFKKKPGGTLFGNLLRGAVGVIPVVGGTVLGTGANKIELGQTKTNAELAKEATTFAGQPATTASDGTISITKPLEEVNISTSKAKIETPMPAWVDKIGDVLSNLGGRATEQTRVGVDNNTLMVVGGVGLAIVAVMAMNNKSRY